MIFCDMLNLEGLIESEVFWDIIMSRTGMTGSLLSRKEEDKNLDE